MQQNKAQRLAVLLGKALSLFRNIVEAHKTGSILKEGFALSK